jgi:hypothetical protein
MSKTPVLVLLNFDHQFVIETDAYEKGVRAMLSQNGHPVGYFSKDLSIANQKLSTYEKEFLAIFMVVDKWRRYLSRQPFVIKTDHQSFWHLQDQSLSTKLQRKAMVKLAGLQFKLQYKKRLQNKVAAQASSMVVPVWIQEITNSYTIDEAARRGYGLVLIQPCKLRL